jgi:hypothetical protein
MSNRWMSYDEYVRLRFVNAVHESLAGFYLWGKTPTAEDQARAAQKIFAALSEAEQEHCRPILTRYIPSDVNT